jgi:nondiscriminating aspartyl-tRNA synthetase
VQRIHVHELPEHAGERVRVAGWLQHQRRLSRLSFLLLRDRTGIAQVIVKTPDLVAEVAALQPESVLEVEASVVAAEQAPGGVELHEPTIRVLSPSATPSPIDLRLPVLKEQLPTQLDHAAVSLRHPRKRATFELAAASIAGYRASLDGLGFTEIQTPKIVGSATESGANVFGIDYFGRPAYLAQSPQFYKQTMVGVFERVYETGPVFRAEPHDTPRHLAEYVSLDAELGFIEDHFTVMRFAREAIAGMVEGVRTRAAGAIELLELELPEVPEEIPVVHFSEAQQLIEAATGEKVIGEPDLAPAHERWLGEWVRREHGSDFVFVAGYPMAKRPFYIQPDPARSEFSNSFDLLFRGLELITGGQRLHRYEDYVAALAARGEAPEAYETYLEAFKHGMPPHGGFAIGLERWVARLVEATNIRETTLFPRDLTRLVP